MTICLRVDVAPRFYDVWIGAGLLVDAGQKILGALPRATTAIIVTDQTVGARYAEALKNSLVTAAIKVKAICTVPAGEAAKSLEGYSHLVQEILSAEPDRDTVIIALGGGVVGDLAGFAAATVLRGVPFVQIPTTLLAQVDSAVGGKTGINMPQGKNMLGAFHQPALVLSDVGVLATLPEREIKAGYAEIVKSALIADADFFSWLERNGAEVLLGNKDILVQAVFQACRIKANIVTKDPLETGSDRVLLNLGHTFGHALESLAGYDGRLLHGEAVAIGLLWATRFSERQKMLSADQSRRIQIFLQAAGLMQAVPFDWRPADVVQRMAADKKNKNGQIRLVLLQGIGQAIAVPDIAQHEILDFLKEINL